MCSARCRLERSDTRRLTGDATAFAYGLSVCCRNRDGRGGVRRHYDTQPDEAALNAPVRHNASAYRFIFAAGPRQPAARLWLDVEMLKARRLFVRINARDGAPHPLAYRTKRPVVKRIHLRVLESPPLHITVPSFP